MSRMIRHLAVIFSLVLAVGLGAHDASAQARRGKSAKTVKKAKSYRIKDGRQARPAVIRNYRSKGRSTNVRVHSFGRSRSGKSLQVLVESKGSGRVRSLNVRDSNGVAYETRTQAFGQGKANVKANRKLHRQNGTFSGINKSGLSRSGKSYKYNSATDRRAKTGDRAYVNARTGKARKRTRGR